LDVRVACFIYFFADEQQQPERHGVRLIGKRRPEAVLTPSSIC
jgi:hypothetical protein